jgi:hypothetical protein
MSLYSRTAGEPPTVSSTSAPGRNGTYRGSGLYPTRGLDAKAIDAAQAKARHAVLPLKALFEHAEYSEVERLATRLAVEQLQGRLTPERRKAWDEQVLADVRATHARSDKAGRELLTAVNTRLWHELPSEASYHALKSAAVGHHPQFARAAIAWHYRRTGEDASREAGRGYVGKARGDRKPATVVVD